MCWQKRQHTCITPLHNLILQGNPLKQLQLRAHDDAITAMHLSHNGALLATGQRGSNSDVVVWDTQTLAQKFRWGKVMVRDLSMLMWLIRKISPASCG